MMIIIHHDHDDDDDADDDNCKTKFLPYTNLFCWINTVLSQNTHLVNKITGVDTAVFVMFQADVGLYENPI
jgi:hypothetical protein